jgi:hypothetical protein
MIRALYNGDGMYSFMHNLISMLLTASRPGLRAPDREADPVAGWQVIPRRRARAADGARSVGDESRPNASGSAVSLGSIAGPARAWRRDPAHRRETVREIREQFGSAAGTGK